MQYIYIVENRSYEEQVKSYNRYEFPAVPDSLSWSTPVRRAARSAQVEVSILRVGIDTQTVLQKLMVDETHR